MAVEETARATKSIDDSADADRTWSPVCTYCKWWGAHPDRWKFCSAYPHDEGKPIPAVIWSGKNMHLHPYAGDHNIQFAPAKGVKRTPANAKLLDAYAAAQKQKALSK